ncbi:MAG: type II toxin-antitoxin system ParD family antitoxin [Planctomycetaceae bacterium]|nr:type II toxin-antitoxin system ParD family antitoxin [Planctomycetaceae bacterium]
MTITVPPEFAQFVAERIASGRFRSEEDALTEALDLLRRREQKLEALRAEIQIGLDAIEAGRIHPFDAEDIIRRGRERLSGQSSADA